MAWVLRMWNTCKKMSIYKVLADIVVSSSPGEGGRGETRKKKKEKPWWDCSQFPQKTLQHGHAYACHLFETPQAFPHGLLLSFQWGGRFWSMPSQLVPCISCRAVLLEVTFSEVRGAVLTGGNRKAIELHYRSYTLHTQIRGTSDFKHPDTSSFQDMWNLRVSFGSVVEAIA